MAQQTHASLGRTWRHASSSSAAARRAFPPATLKAIGDAITAGEQTHRGEVRLIVEKAMPLGLVWRGASNRERALALFAEYAMWDTEEHCGVLLYVNLADRKVEIVADRGIDRKIDAPTWQQVCATQTAGYARGEFHDSTLAAIAQVNALLRQHFPATGPRPNELPDEPIML
jgi:uncharacterized membrane protein